MSVSDLDRFQPGKNTDKKSQFIREWETPELDLHKYYSEINHLLAGYLSDYDSPTIIPELQSREDLMREDNFMRFTTIDNSLWDGKPLVNAIWTGTQFTAEGMEWYQTTEEVKEIINGLLGISKKGFRDRYRNETKSAKPFPQNDWDDEEMIDCLTSYYNQMVNYYLNTANKDDAMLVCLSC